MIRLGLTVGMSDENGLENKPLKERNSKIESARNIVYIDIKLAKLTLDCKLC